MMRSICIAVAASMLWSIAPLPAEAGTPYWCTCAGQKKRFIGGSRGCEVDRERAAGTAYEGGLFKYRRCTASEFSAWRKKACAYNKCVAIKS